MQSKSSKVSKEIAVEALKVAKATQKKGQSKEQTKLIALGIQKGIAQYKKEQKAKSRELDKLKKKKRKEKESIAEQPVTDELHKYSTYLPWGLLFVSWSGFIAYFLLVS
ncbi:DUF2956 family protein [Aliikangiella sp. G2MR2-5]|uniref:DUF2956 family protein n=1 Tax=Aliikangiella sp. G2MR2-5 TaxID=2788943 RepID=UPI0018A91E91|nr:DUF2956 family protein [Aliikangiella sp. G2MR2-5]